MFIKKLRLAGLVGSLLFVTACSKGGGSDAAGISPSISGTHSLSMEYVRPGDEDVSLSGTIQLNQGTDGALSGNVSIVSDSTQFERCYRGGEILSDSSRVSGTTFTIVWDDIRGDRISVNGSIVGRSLDGVFVATDTDAEEDGGGNGCSGRTGSFSTTF